MPSKVDILRVIASKGPIHRQQIASQLGEESYRSFQTQLDRAVKQGLLVVTADGCVYQITDSGRKYLVEVNQVTLLLLGSRHLTSLLLLLP